MMSKSKIFCFSANPNQMHIPDILSHRGALRTSRNAGRDAVDAAAPDE
jgi:hypothetical protein